MCTSVTEIRGIPADGHRPMASLNGGLVFPFARSILSTNALRRQSLVRCTGALALVVAAVTSTGCATKVAGLKADDSFNYQSVTNGRLAIGGVTAFAALAPEVKAQYANLLQTNIQELRGAYELVPTAAVKAQMGDDAYAQLMERYGTMGSLDEGAIGALQAVKAARYVAFALVESDTVKNDRQELPKRDSKGKAIGNRREVHKTSVRTVTASLQIYDVAEGKRVWSGSLTKTARNANVYDLKNDGLLVDLVKAAADIQETDEELYPAPSEPTSDVVLAQVFKGFAENMPEE